MHTWFISSFSYFFSSPPHFTLLLTLTSRCLFLQLLFFSCLLVLLLLFLLALTQNCSCPLHVLLSLILLFSPFYSFPLTPTPSLPTYSGSLPLLFLLVIFPLLQLLPVLPRVLHLFFISPSLSLPFLAYSIASLSSLSPFPRPYSLTAPLLYRLSLSFPLFPCIPSLLPSFLFFSPFQFCPSI